MKRLTFIPLCATLFLMVYSCGGGHAQEAQNLSARIQVALAMTSKEAVDSTTVDLSSADITPIHRMWVGIPATLELGGLAPGSARNIVVTLYAGGVAIQKGEASFDLIAGELRNVPITLHALYGFLELDVPLGLQNPMGVNTGRVLLGCTHNPDTLALQGTLPNRFFRSGSLPLNADYCLVVDLYDSTGKAIYHGADTLHLDEQSPQVTLTLGSLVGSVSLQLTATTSPTITSRVILAGSRRRVPQSAHDLLILELLPNPKTSGDDWEYTEVFNATLDTLVLDSCKLAKSRASTTESTAANLLGCAVMPGQFAIIGRDSVGLRNCSAGSFTLANTSQSVVLACGNLLVDSIAYNSPTDSLNPFPLQVGKSLEIPLAHYSQRNNGAAWCADKDSVKLSANFSVLGSPGIDATCAE